MQFDRKILAVQPKKFFGIILKQVDLRANLFCFSRREAADVRIAMQADKDSLKQFMRAARGGGQDLFVVHRETAD